MCWVRGGVGLGGMEKPWTCVGSFSLRLLPLHLVPLQALAKEARSPESWPWLLQVPGTCAKETPCSCHDRNCAKDRAGRCSKGL